LATEAAFETLEDSNSIQAGVVDPVPDDNHITLLTPLQNVRTREIQPDPSPRSIFEAIHNESPASQRQQITSNHVGAIPTPIGDMDSCLLGVYGPKNQLCADNQAFVAQLEHKY
jgi:hypothetical protein